MNAIYYCICKAGEELKVAVVVVAGDVLAVLCLAQAYVGNSCRLPTRCPSTGSVSLGPLSSKSCYRVLGLSQTDIECRTGVGTTIPECELVVTVVNLVRAVALLVHIEICIA